MDTMSILKSVKGTIHYGLNEDLGNTVFLAGLPRSGSTWISEIINFRNDYRYVFEPFFPKYVPQVRNIKENQYVKISDNSILYYKIVKNILTGKIRNLWVDRFNSKVFYKRRLIKAIRSNLILGWINHNFPEVRIILLLRHPFSNIFSWSRLGWGAGVDWFFSQNDLIEEYIGEFIPHVEKAATEWERYVFMWCILNYVPLKQFENSGKIYICFYENFCVDVYNQTLKLFDFLNMETSDLDEDKLTRPSAMSKQHSAVLTGEDMVSGWKTKITDTKIQRGLEILNLFGLDKLYDDSPLPKK